ncbi:antibiotic biosynthesis monooxygenase [Sporosarcina sp. ANT_H38]|uniref:antibiotic biosynthesis monooxygenase family protein n=1 Tax=Sporosarcina sp. ANT_H38 TaxID=2597358 RepID=UPI0011F3062B|nr:antibiotic biosynthesis monooxygenase [Sporosarcina sp. ANT_H38]KAA0966823.1 antibiotic biosynthesis monooxygenase [Sporosarcina sp. ANT_H38]
MNIYMTSGTPDFMESLKNKYVSEGLLAMHGDGNSLLLHETAGKTVFQTPRRYEIISSSGTLQENGYFVFNNIPVTDEGRPVFEHDFKERASTIESELGFIAFRLLRPLDSDTYIVLTEWSSNTYYTRWKNSTSFGQTHAGVDNTPHIFSSAPYVTTYMTRGE